MPGSRYHSPIVPKRLIICALGLLAAVLLLPFDQRIVGLLEGLGLHGDVRRELLALQQYGQFSFTVIAAILIWRLQPQRTRRLLDLALAAGLTALAATLIKRLTGRARPPFGDPWAFVGPFGSFDPGGGDPPVTVWSDSYVLASMPSSHTSAAVVLSVFIAILYPRLRVFAIVMASIVAACRLLFGAHYLSDVVAGAVLGGLIGGIVIRGYGGVRLLDWIWTRWIRPGDAPALPRVLATEAACARSNPAGRAAAESHPAV